MKPNTRLAPVAALAALLVLPAAAAAQQQWRADPRRERLEAEVLSRFVSRAARDLELDGDGRARLESVLRASAERRRAIAQEARLLRQELDRTLRDPATPDGEFESLLERLAALRTRELEQWHDEQRALAGVLTPRQRARFLVLAARFQERVRELRRRDAGQPPGPPPQ